MSDLIERERELSMLGKCLDAVRSSSRGRLVLVAGEAGVGKTALLRRFCDDRPGDSDDVVLSRAYRGKVRHGLAGQQRPVTWRRRTPRA